MSISVFLLEQYDDEFVDKLRKKLDAEIDLYYGEEIPDPAEYEILVAGVPEREHLTASPRLHTLIIPWAGIPTRTRELLLEIPDIKVHNLHYNDIPVAETAFALMLAAAKYIIPIDRRFRHHDWRPRYNPYPSVLLNGGTALILGYGTIGKQIAKLCHGFGMKVKAVKRNPEKKSDDIAEIFSIDKLLYLLPDTNVLFVSLPMTPDTRGIIGKEELALLPDRAIVVNIARGPIIDEEALYNELYSERLLAGLDVWYHYPKTEEARRYHEPSDFDFNLLENVVMTPHLAEQSDKSQEMNIDSLAEMLNRAARGEELPNRVDLQRGY
ncbi:MAG TPA: hydroxyacid dehydrogenase [candidate division Zixibacteria bacterium]|nr:hydroxyacid dehydrogenase [candidate division Zixibacteria bacterium]